MENIYRYAIYKPNSYVQKLLERNLVNIELGNRHIEKQCAHVPLTMETSKNPPKQQYLLHTFYFSIQLTKDT